MLRKRAFRDGEYLITQGTVGTEFFLLAEGKVKILVNGNQVAELGSGAFFGEQALMKAQPRNADVVAVGKCLVLELKQNAW